jgi:predicted MPP superfamily phosphohydrolase
LTRRKFLSILPAAAAVPAYGHYVEPQWLDVVRWPVPVPGLQAPVRVAQLSDLHLSAFVPIATIERAADLAIAARPDLFALTGDFVTNAASIDTKRYARCLRRISNAAPAYACLGNHDGGPWCESIGGFGDTSLVRSVLRDGRVNLLDNRSEVVTVRGARFNLAGTGDLWNNDVDADATFASLESSLPTVLLAHNPDTKDVVADRPWNLMLSGHTHGGQVMLFGVEKEFIPVKDKRYVAGLGEWQGRTLYVTRGVGSLGGIRLNCRPEVTILELQPAVAASPTA